jgi:ATP-binding cassette subfamily A (ABC1) protein 4
LLPESAIGYGFTMIAFADKEKLATWKTFDQIQLAGLNLTHIFGAFVLDTVIYSVLAWYTSAVFPGKYGVALPFYFCFTPSYWMGSKIDRVEKSQSLSGVFSNDTILLADENFEPMPSTQKIAVDIRNLVKIYDNNTQALDSLNVSFYENQITAFLGESHIHFLIEQF